MFELYERVCDWFDESSLSCFFLVIQMELLIFRISESDNDNMMCGLQSVMPWNDDICKVRHVHKM